MSGAECNQLGFICLPRRILNHPSLNPPNEPFDLRSAFNWLVANAAWQPTVRPIGRGRRMVRLERGQLSHSTRFLAQAWNWSQTRVRVFIAGLSNDSLVGSAQIGGQTLITIENYEQYQGIKADGPILRVVPKPEGNSGPGSEKTQTQLKESITGPTARATPPLPSGSDGEGEPTEGPTGAPPPDPAPPPQAAPDAAPPVPRLARGQLYPDEALTIVEEFLISRYRFWPNAPVVPHQVDCASAARWLKVAADQARMTADQAVPFATQMFNDMHARLYAIAAAKEAAGKRDQTGEPTKASRHWPRQLTFHDRDWRDLLGVLMNPLPGIPVGGLEGLFASLPSGGSTLTSLELGAMARAWDERQAAAMGPQGPDPWDLPMPTTSGRAAA